MNPVLDASARLRAYDAVYVALATREESALFTLDRKVARRVGACFPELEICFEARGPGS